MLGKLTGKQKFFHFICYPLFTFVVIYLISYIAGLIIDDLSRQDEPITSLAIATGVSIAHWINLLYPPKPERDPEDSERDLKFYINKFILNGSPFHRLMLSVYIVCIIFTII